MENAVDALKMAFATLSFVIALSIAFMMFSQAREVSNIVVAHTDRDYYAKWVSANENNKEGRTVGVETIIPTLYRYYKEKFSVRISSRGGIERFDEIIETGVNNNLKYDSDSDGNKITYRDKYGHEYKDTDVISVPWVGSSATEANKLNIDIQKRVDYYVSGGSGEINYVNVNRYESRNLDWDKTYTEKFFQKYNGTRLESNDGSIVDLIKGTTSLYITYQQQGG